MAETNTAPSPNFSTIDFNPAFFTTSTALTLDEADSLYLNKSSPDTANVLETFAAGIVANSIQSTGLLLVNAFDSFGSTLTLGSSNATSVTTNFPFSASSIDSVGSTLTLGPTNATSVTTSKPFSANSIDSVGSTLTLGPTNATTVTTTKPFTANSYNLTGTAPTLSKSSLNYFVNCGVVSSGQLTTAGTNYVYSPAANASTASTNYLNPGIYEATVNAYVVQANGPTISGCTFYISVCSGAGTGTLSTTAQYGTLITGATSPTFSSNNNGGGNFNGFGTGFSHTYCFTLASAAFVNLELRNTITTITNGNITFQVYGIIRRIG